MSFLRNCGLRALQTAAVAQMPPTKISGMSTIINSRMYGCSACRRLQVQLGVALSRSDLSHQTVMSRRMLSSSNRNISNSKPYFIVVRKTESPHSSIAEVENIRIEQLLNESVKQAKPETFHPPPSKNVKKAKKKDPQDQVIPNTKKKKKAKVSKSIPENAKQGSKSIPKNVKKDSNSVSKNAKQDSKSIPKNVKQGSKSIPKNVKKDSKSVSKNAKKSSKSIPENAKQGSKNILENAKQSSKSVPENAKQGSKSIPGNAKQGSKNIPENAKQSSMNVPENAKQSSKSVPENAKQGSKNIPENAKPGSKNIPENAKQSSKSVPENAKQSSKSVPENAKPGSKNIPENAKQSSKNIPENAKQSSKSVPENAKKSSKSQNNPVQSYLHVEEKSQTSHTGGSTVENVADKEMARHKLANVSDRTRKSPESRGKERTRNHPESRTRNTFESESGRTLTKQERHQRGVSDQLGDETTQPNKGKGKKQDTDQRKVKKDELQDEKRYYHILEDTTVYLEPMIEVCNFKDMVGLALSEYETGRKSNMKMDVGIYNMLMEGLAQKGDLGNIQTLFTNMASSDIQPNAQSFASVLQCIGRMKAPNPRLASKCLSDMAVLNINIDDLFLKTSFANDDRAVMLDVIQSVRPKYNPPKLLPPPRATPTIVRDLYRDEAYLEIQLNEASDNRTLGYTGFFAKDRFQEKFKEQLDIEIQEEVNIKSIEDNGKPDPQMLEKRRILREHKRIWKKNLAQAIKEERQGCKKHMENRGLKPTYTGLYYPLLNILTPEEFADLLLQKVMDTLAYTSEGMAMGSFSHTLGHVVHRKLAIRSKIKRGIAEKLEKLYNTFFEYYLDEKLMQRYKPREYWHHLEDDMVDGPSLNYEAKPWKGVTNSILGMLLADILIRELKIDTAIINPKKESKMFPALYNVYTFKGFKNTIYIKPHPVLVDLVEGAKDPNLPFETTVLPMLVPPVPWKSLKYGGYILTETRIVRSAEGAQQDRQLSDRSKLHEWYPVMDSLNQLSSVPWKVNKPILDVIISVFNNNGSKELNIPQPASALPQPPSITSETSKSDVADVYRERATYQKLKGEMHSLRMTDLYKLSIANRFRDEVFWFPHSLDFRGRVYPCPPHFNHLGNDVARSILVFAGGRPLGERGLDWLKIHLVNLTGFLKRGSQKDRLDYADEKMPLILDSADNPLEGKKWWQGADKQWQSLACCMEIANAIRSGNPAEFISHFPIHQDGSCNGLQHYAALGRDTIGAQQVNLHPYDIPQDVYSGVADMVEKQRAKDAENGNTIAKLLEGHVERKVVKQTVMTIVYGVSSYGAKLQILKQLREKDGMNSTQKNIAARYLADCVFNSLQKMFTKTRQIQGWLTEMAKHISKSGHCVDWETPLGFPVTQPYINSHVKSHTIQGRVFQGIMLENNSAVKIDTRKQKNGFAPNFIHSLDSTHMMLTSLYCQQADITFVSVHDCYWTHASTVEDMNRICREQFVKLHEEPILEDLSHFLMNKYGTLKIQKALKSKNPELVTIGDLIKQVPDPGDFDLKNVLQSTYFFS